MQTDFKGNFCLKNQDLFHFLSHEMNAIRGIQFQVLQSEIAVGFTTLNSPQIQIRNNTTQSIIIRFI